LIERRYYNSLCVIIAAEEEEEDVSAEDNDNITTYTGIRSLWINSEKIFDIDINARVFPNSTAILEMTET
jgi:hypothetical protein